MSRRDIVVNTLLGIFLVAFFLLPFFLFVVIAQYSFHAIAHLLPGTATPAAVIVGTFSVFSLISGVRYAWKRHWRNAFLSFAMLPAFASILLADPRSFLGLHAPLWMFGLLPIFAISEGAGPTRSQFLLAASTICAVIAINTGLLGRGHLAQLMTASALVGLSIWFVLDKRQGLSGTKDAGPKDPLSPNHA